MPPLKPADKLGDEAYNTISKTKFTNDLFDGKESVVSSPPLLN